MWSLTGNAIAGAEHVPNVALRTGGSAGAGVCSYGRWPLWIPAMGLLLAGSTAWRHFGARGRLVMRSRVSPRRAPAPSVHEERNMNRILRDSDAVELSDPPAFSFGQKLRANRVIRNDGTYPGKEIGDVLVKKGEVGYVVSIGTFLQQFYIYGVEFLESGHRVGMKRKELEPVDAGEEVDDLPLPEES
ncbi:nitrogen fixation protein NifZ [Bradyrhizobium diazoefficiens]